MSSIPRLILKYIPLPIIDFLIFLFIYPSAFLLKSVRVIGIKDLPLCKSALMSIGVFPIRSHYYEPLFDMRDLKRPLSDNRVFLGIDWNTEIQLAILEDFDFNEELSEFPKEKEDDLTFHYDNDFFGPGDAEHWYNTVRKFKPHRIFEIGSGNSTLLAAAAIRVRPETL